MDAVSLPISFARQTVIRVRAELLPKNSRGERLRDWANAAEKPLLGWIVTPGATAELLAGRESALIQWTAIGPSGVDVVTTDRIRLPGDDTAYQIDGEPARWPSPTGALDSTVLLLKKWEG